MSGFIPLSVPNFGEKEAAYAAEAITSAGFPPAVPKLANLRKHWLLM